LLTRRGRRRYNEPGQPRELTFSCYRHYPFLESEQTRGWFVEFLEAARRRYAIPLWAYVLMPEHVHLLVYPAQHPVPIEIDSMILEELARRRVAMTHARPSHPCCRACHAF
jgi:putative transposase